MPTVWIPPLMRSHTGDQKIVTVQGENLAQVIDNLDVAYPGLKERLLQDGRLRPGISAAVDGEITVRGLYQRVQPESEIHFVPAIGGGSLEHIPPRALGLT